MSCNAMISGIEGASRISSVFYECVEDVDVAVIVTEWEQFRALDLAKNERSYGLSGCH
jgi:UDP-glucose 6-dehydrogenase